MFKKLAIAAACRIALYGLAKLLNRHIQPLPDRPGPVPTNELPEAGETAAPENRQPIGDGFYPDTTDTSVKPHHGAGGVSCNSGRSTAKSSSVRRLD